jgi:hypothetical protein
MNDSNKRTSLKTLVATALATGLPAVAGATAGLTASGAPVVISEGASVAAGSAVNVVFGTRDAQGAHTVTLSNTGDKPITLKHIYPGRVIVDREAYDLNALFDQHERTLAPGQSLRAQLDTSDRNQPERGLPAGLSFTDAVQVTTPLATVGALNTVSTTRRVLT